MMSKVVDIFEWKSKRGGEGSGNFGHEGRPGEQGGSGGGGSSEIKQLNEEQESAVRWYGSTVGHQNINDYLRYGKVTIQREGTVIRDPPEGLLKMKKEYIDSVVSNIDSSMNPLKEDTQVIRVLRGEGISRHTEGAVIEDKGYMSTSTDMSFADKWKYGPLSENIETGLILILNVPRGTKVLDVSKTSADYSESELLLQRGLSYKVDKIDGNKVYANIV